MTIKEVEQHLDVPRATVRFYEKEGLINPKRGENGYREYSEKDVVRLKQIIIFRKLGMTIVDIEDILNGVKPLSEAIANNISNLEKQIDELKGALVICHRLQEEKEEIETFEVDKFWKVIEEEEKKGNRFLNIAKDVIRFEKATMLEYFGLADINGNLMVSIPKAIWTVVLAVLGSGCVICIMEGSWNIQNFYRGIVGLLSIMLVECVIGLPVYMLGKKFPKVAKHKVKILIGVCLVLCVVLLILASILEG